MYIMIDMNLHVFTYIHVYIFINTRTFTYVYTYIPINRFEALSAALKVLEESDLSHKHPTGSRNRGSRQNSSDLRVMF